MTYDIDRFGESLLTRPQASPEHEARERDLATRAVQRLAGGNIEDLLDALGLATPAGSEPLTEKPCSKCKQTKPVTDFYRDPRARIGLMSQCKTCHAAYRRTFQERARAAGGYHNLPGNDSNITWRVSPVGGKGLHTDAATVAGRIDTYIELRTARHHTIRQAAERMEISMRTARRYEQAMQKRPQLEGQEAA